MRLQVPTPSTRKWEYAHATIAALAFAAIAVAAGWAIATPGWLNPAGARTRVSTRPDRTAGVSKGAPAAPAVAFVDGTPIGEEDLGIRLEEMVPRASYHGHLEPDRLLALKRAALDELVLDELIYREAIANGGRASDAAVDAELQQVAARFDDATQFAAALAENRLSDATFRQRLARGIIVRESRAAHTRQTITDADVGAYYQANAAMFQRPERVHLLQLLVRCDPADPASRATAERKARSLLARVRHGESFASIARAESEDEYRVKDGDMGFVHRGRLDPAFEDAVFAAGPGRFQLAESLYGFEVFKVIERQPATRLSLHEARPIITERLERLGREGVLRAWYAKLLSGARVEILDPALRAAHPLQVAPAFAPSARGIRPAAFSGGPS